MSGNVPNRLEVAAPSPSGQGPPVDALSPPAAEEQAAEAAESRRGLRHRSLKVRAHQARLATWASLTLLFLALALTTRYNYLLFHSLVEVFGVVVTSCIFVIAWNSRARLQNNYLLFLGVACSAIGALDLLHALAFKGMGVFPEFDTNLATQLWIAGRYVQSLSLVAAPFFVRRRLDAGVTLLGYVAVTALVLALVFGGRFPECYREGVGLTSFKTASEYVISSILVVSIAALLAKRAAFDRQVLLWLVASAVLTIAAELAFTLYVGVSDLANLLGHLLRMLASCLIFVGIVETGLTRPQRLLFRNLKRKEARLRAALAEVERLAITDSLTGLDTRRHFVRRAEAEIRRAVRHRLPLSAIMLDVDHFKQVNDTAGHAVGDLILRRVADYCREELRQTDIVGRYGGDEIVALLPEVDQAGATLAAERLRQRVAGELGHVADGLAGVTVSLGTAGFSGDVTLEALLARADQALYEAKRGGRNRVCGA